MHKLFIISGPSGSGKTSLMKAIMDNEIISTTTRAIRKHQNEMNGIDYYFISKHMFKQLIKEEELVEWNEYTDHYYGITKSEIENKRQKGHAFAVVEFGGMQKLKALVPEAVSIFIYASFEDVKQQLIDRGETNEMIERRLHLHAEEIATKGFYDYVIPNKNGQFMDTVSVIKQIIDMES